VLYYFYYNSVYYSIPIIPEINHSALIKLKEKISPQQRRPLIDDDADVSRWEVISKLPPIPQHHIQNVTFSQNLVQSPQVGNIENTKPLLTDTVDIPLTPNTMRNEETPMPTQPTNALNDDTVKLTDYLENLMVDISSSDI